MARLRLLTAGESHGPKVAAILEGAPAGLRLDPRKIDQDLARRQAGYGRGARMRSIEKDTVVFGAGVRFGETIGAPILIEIMNLDHASWSGVMEPLPAADMGRAEEKALHRPRPGHADLTGGLKFGRSDLRDVLERASARSTCVRVAAGAIAKALLAELGVRVFSVVTEIAGAKWPLPDRDLGRLADAAEASELRCPDPDASERMKLRIDEARKAGDTAGGTFAVIATGVPAGWGTYGEWDARLDGRLAQAVMSIQAVKAVGFGIGTRNGEVFGSEAHDEIAFDPESRGNGAGGYFRRTNRAGGLEGGMTNGEDLIVVGTMKPISTLARPLESVDVRTKESAKAGYERSDICAVPACAVIAEAAVAYVLADAALEVYGGDTIEEVKAAHARRLERYARS